ncbi:hypothetical protein GW17_00058838, partial [Ensete ventricosum]
MLLEEELATVGKQRETTATGSLPGGRAEQQQLCWKTRKQDKGSNCFGVMCGSRLKSKGQRLWQERRKCACWWLLAAADAVDAAEKWKVAERQCRKQQEVVRRLVAAFVRRETKVVAGGSRLHMSGDSGLGLESRLLEWWSPGEEGVIQFGSAANSCKEVGSGAFIVGAVDHSYLITLLPLWLTIPPYPPTMLAVLAMRRAFAGGGCRPYLCQVCCTSTGAPGISGRLPASGRPRRRANYPRV